MSKKKLTANEQLVHGIVLASLEMAALRHDLCLEDGPPMVHEQVLKIVEDTWNALRGIDTCLKEKAPEYTAIMNALTQKART